MSEDGTYHYRIYIPSRSRYNNLKTLMNLTESVHDNISVVVPLSQVHEYTVALPGDVTVVGFSGEGIGAKRDFILNLYPTGNVIMFDDDLTFYKRNEDGSKFTRTTPDDTLEMIISILNILGLYAMAGVTDKFMSQTKPRGSVQCQRFNQILGINRDLLPKPWPTFELTNDEEHHFHLQLLTRGYRTAVLTEWSKSDKFNAPGGCSDWRTNDTLHEAHMKLLRYWPSIVTIDSSARPKARYNWKEAKRVGGLIT